MKSLLRSAFLGLALTLIAVGASAQPAKNPELGVWKLNLEKSRFNPGPPPRENMITMEAVGDGVRYSSKGVNSEGKPTSQEYTTNYDGSDVPLTGSALADTMSIRRIDAYTVERVTKKAGKVVSTAQREYSKDGKSFTTRITGTNAKGETFNNVEFFERM